MKIKIVPKNKKLLKSSRVRGYLDHIGAIVEKKIDECGISMCPVCGTTMMRVK